jgi:hypothetical protein
VNLLIDDLPTAVEIDGHEYLVNSDFRTCLRVILAFEDFTLTGYEKQIIMLSNLYPQPIDNVPVAIKQALKFMNGGQDGKEEAGSAPRLYSFAKDASLIFAAFRQTHGIDLETAEMHWWKFLALFMDLGPDTTFCNLVNLRKRIKSGDATKEEQKAASEIGDMLEIPEADNRTLEEQSQDDEFFRLVAEAEKKREGK